MIVTVTSFAQYRLLLIAKTISSKTKLMGLDWLDSSQSWSDSKSLVLLKNHHNFNDKQFRFIDENSLSNKNKTEAMLITTIEQLQQYINGKRHQFDIELDWSMGTPFQKNVWQALMQIPYGQTISYSKLAQNIGKPTAYRAVANANGKNPFSIIIPCHRVVASNGSLGGYTGGLDKKRLLLNIEIKYDKPL